MINKYGQAGFTLIELMISIVLGLIVVAAAIQLFITGQASLNMQRAMAEIQDNGNFAVGFITTDIRKANLDAVEAVINDSSLYSGVLLTGVVSYPTLTEAQKKTITANLPANLTADNVPRELMTRGAGQSAGSGDKWTGASNANGTAGDSSAVSQSDQLVIQYKAHEVNTADCEGNSISQTDIDEGTYIVQRYFLRADGSTSTNLALACDAGRYKTSVATLPTEITGYGDAGQILMRRVDHFHVLFGIKENASDEYRYVSVKDYMGTGATDLTLGGAPRPRIMSVQIGVLVRGTDSVKDSFVLNTNEYQVLDQKVRLNDNVVSGSKYLRQVVSQTIALRNGYGVMEALK